MSCASPGCTNHANCVNAAGQRTCSVHWEHLSRGGERGPHDFERLDALIAETKRLSAAAGLWRAA